MRNPELTLRKVIRSFKALSTHSIHQAGYLAFAWQRNYYDHIIRNDNEHFMIQQYIKLNPIFWEYDKDNAQAKSISSKNLKRCSENDLISTEALCARFYRPGR